MAEYVSRLDMYDEACEYFEKARKCLATELVVLVVEYCTLLLMGNPIVEGRRALFPNMWNERIKGVKRNDEVNFRTSLSE
ncbi:hypothetical protein H5410_045662 [Solanum commersonii]|uniref:Uncharacterized protein n=1 Tax=Solanum commersonii TaxID=4109 RepID=A0A9J5XDE5_SOLCO|nr:hypothetical protein H5410_045662 [Solanum commersonii]